MDDDLCIFGCAVCLSLVHRPVALSCGHTFCRGCLRSCLESKAQCPTCRTSCSDNAWKSCENVSITQYIQKHHFQQWQSRESTLTENPDDIKSFSSTCMSFSFMQISFQLFPHQPGRLHIFESRYLLMLDRARASNNMFVIHDYGMRGDIGTLVRIKEIVCERFGPIRSIDVDVVCVNRVRFVNDAESLSNNEDRRVRLKSCTVELVEDDDCSVLEADLTEDIQLKILQLRNLVKVLYPHLTTAQQEYLHLFHGECPLTAQWQQLTCWMSSAVRMTRHDRNSLIVANTAQQRVQLLHSIALSRVTMLDLASVMCACGELLGGREVDLSSLPAEVLRSFIATGQLQSTEPLSMQSAKQLQHQGERLAACANDLFEVWHDMPRWPPWPWLLKTLCVAFLLLAAISGYYGGFAS